MLPLLLGITIIACLLVVIVIELRAIHNTLIALRSHIHHINEQLPFIARDSQTTATATKQLLSDGRQRDTF